jgi:hypothetical protein
MFIVIPPEIEPCCSGSPVEGASLREIKNQISLRLAQQKALRRKHFGPLKNHSLSQRPIKVLPQRLLLRQPEQASFACVGWHSFNMPT